MGPTHAPIAWNIRHKTTSAMLDDSAHPTEPMANIAMPMMRGFFLPMRSLIGPQMSWASAKPTTNPVTVSSESPWRSASIVGRAGR